jgi:undecaprenyl-diphosphatase
VAIWGLMRILHNFATWPFVVYRIILGVVIVGGVAIGWVS